MEVIDRIKNCKNDEELYYLTKKLIKEAMKEVKGVNRYRGLIGTKSEINQKEIDFDPNQNERISFSVPFWDGYIPLGTKIVYGIACGKGFTFDSNCGYYYYVDDDSYVYDFIKSIKDWEIDDPFDLISIINGYVRKLFENYFNPVKRMDMHKLLLEKDFHFFEPIKEHSIKDFYGNGSAQCTEYALVASNLLSVMGFPVYYCMDTSHAFNVFFNLNEEDEYDGYILDYSDSIDVYDELGNYIGRYPYFEKIKTKEKKYIILNDESIVEVDVPNEEEKDEDFFEDFVNNGKRVRLNDMFAVRINGHLYKAIKNNDRDYGVECNKVEDKKVLTKKR